jgi:hypothetical protein
MSSALHPTPNLEDQVSVFLSPSDRAAKLYPQAPASLFFAFYDSHGYGGGILTTLHMGDKTVLHTLLTAKTCRETQQNDVKLEGD